MTKLSYSNSDKTQIQIVTTLKTHSDNSISDKTKNSLLVKTTGQLNNRWDVLWAAFCNHAMFEINSYIWGKAGLLLKRTMAFLNSMLGLFGWFTGGFKSW